MLCKYSGKYIDIYFILKITYFMGMKEILPESDFVYGLRTVLCDATSEF